MKKQLYVYAILVIAFIVYNQFFQIEDERTNAIVNILFASVLFLYIGYMAYVLLKRLKERSGK